MRKQKSYVLIEWERCPKYHFGYLYIYEYNFKNPVLKHITLIDPSTEIYQAKHSCSSETSIRGGVVCFKSVFYSTASKCAESVFTGTLLKE